MRCSEAREFTQRLLDGEDLGQDGVRLGVHLARCPRCAAEHGALKELDALLRRSLHAQPAPVPLPGLALDLVGRAAGMLPQAVGLGWRGRRTWPLALCAAGLVALAAVVVVPRVGRPGADRRERPAPSSARAVAQVSAGWDSLHVFEPNTSISHIATAAEPLPSDSMAWATGLEPVVLSIATTGRLRLSADAVISLGADEITLHKGWVRADLSGRKRPFTIRTHAAVITSTDAVLRVEKPTGAARVDVVVDRGAAQVRTSEKEMQLRAGQSVALEPAAPGRGPAPLRAL